MLPGGPIGPLLQAPAHRFDSATWERDHLGERLFRLFIATELGITRRQQLRALPGRADAVRIECHLECVLVTPQTIEGRGLVAVGVHRP